MDIEYLRMLVVNILLYRRIKHIILRPIFNSEVFINNNYRVIKNIFLN